MSMPSSAAKTQFEIEHATVGSIVCDQAPTRRRPARGHVRRTGQAIVAVFTHKPPSAEVLDRLDLLDHPNLVEWLGTCDIDNAVIAISALAEGGSLLDRDAQLHLNEPEIARV
ncbi:MAG: hypothetical protein IH940_12760, partial [Acidobacteria bacterium]|nr:hypothetical protein [Acidobacteriota bacterium]